MGRSCCRHSWRTPIYVDLAAQAAARWQYIYKKEQQVYNRFITILSFSTFRSENAGVFNRALSTVLPLIFSMLLHGRRISSSIYNDAECQILFNALASSCMQRFLQNSFVRDDPEIYHYSCF